MKWYLVLRAKKTTSCSNFKVILILFKMPAQILPQHLRRLQPHLSTWFVDGGGREEAAGHGPESVVLQRHHEGLFQVLWKERT